MIHEEFKNQLDYLFNVKLDNNRKFFDSPCLQKTTKNSDISLKQHFTLMKIQLNCFVSIWYLAKILNNSQWVVFQQNLITDNFSVVFSLSHYSATAIWCSIHDGIYDKAFLNQLFKITPFSRCILNIGSLLITVTYLSSNW